MNAESDLFLSCVIPVHNEEKLIGRFLQQLSAKLQEETNSYEIVIVDDGSNDCTVDQIRKVLPELPVRLIRLSRNFGKEAALTAGLNKAHGKIVITMDADFQHPIDVISELIANWRKGYQMVYAVQHSRVHEGIIKRTITNLFYRFLKLTSGIDIPINAGDFRLMDRDVVEAIKKLSERKRFMKGIYAWVGFNTKSITFDVGKRADGSSRWNKLKLINLALTGITSFTELPLRMVALLGIFIAFLAVIFGLYILGSTLLFGSHVPGWPTLIDIVAFMGGLQMFAIGVLGEYIAGIFSEVKRRPVYIIASEESESKIKNKVSSSQSDSQSEV